MTIKNDDLAPSDIRQLAELQITCLPTSTFSIFGLAFAYNVYSYFLRSNYEFILVEKIDGNIQAACVISVKRNTLAQRLFFKTHFVFHALKLLIKPKLIKLLLGAPKPGGFIGPELIILYTGPNQRRSGLANKLLDRAERQLSQSGHDSYVIHTLNDPKNAAYKFYINNGFVLLDESDQGRQCKMIKKIAAPNRLA